MISNVHPFGLTFLIAMFAASQLPAEEPKGRPNFTRATTSARAARSMSEVSRGIRRKARNAPTTPAATF